MEKFWVVKASGEREPFSEKKLRQSLKRAGASPEIVRDIVSHIEAELEDGMKTQDIYKHAFSILKKQYRPAALAYSLKKAVMEFGPSGFAFEEFIGEILKTKGYRVKVGGILQGACVSHEVDVLAEKDSEHIFVECKFHNQPGVKTDLKVALYVRARFEDIRRFHEDKAAKEGRTPRLHEGWLATNTKLTTQAIKYSKCIGQHVIGWNYPPKGNLQDLIIEAGLHPVTALTTLSQNQKRALLERGVVICRTVKKNPKVLADVGMNDASSRKVLEEISSVCMI